MQKMVRWAAVNEEGLEQLNLTIDQQGVTARGVVIGGDRQDKVTWALTYEVDCDPAWRTRRVKVVNYANGKQIEVFSDGNGAWTGPSGQVLEQLAGCTDVDIR